MSSRLLRLAVVAALLAGCQATLGRGSDTSYRCERIRGYEPGTPAYQDCLYDERLWQRDRRP